MDLFYINLAEQITRREALDLNFAQNLPKHWVCHRVEACTPAEVSRRAIAGTIRPKEKACFESHLKAIAQSLSHTGHAFIAEDDVLFGPSSSQLIEGALQMLPPDGWDILFTDVAIVDPHTMLDLFRLGRDLIARQSIQLGNLADIAFCGATAYIINAQSKQKVLSLLQGRSPRNAPVDLEIRGAIHRSELTGFVIFPFATSLSEQAENSQIQLDDGAITDVTLNSFRRLIWAHGSAKSAMAGMRSVPPEYFDENTDAACRILSAFLSPKCTIK